MINRPAIWLCATLLLAACAGKSNPLKTVRSPCPAVSVLQYGGDLTLFSPADRRDATAIAMEAVIGNLQSSCVTGDVVVATQVDYDVQARRRDSSKPQRLTIPMTSIVMRAGTEIVTKQITPVTLDFAAGQDRASAHVVFHVDVDAQDTKLPPDIQALVQQKRRAGDLSAATDPTTDPQVKQALAQVNFEILIAFQLDKDQLAYNVGRDAPDPAFLPRAR